MSDFFSHLFKPSLNTDTSENALINIDASENVSINKDTFENALINTVINTAQKNSAII